MKTCVDCHKTLPRDQFGRWLSSKDGLQPRCRLCHNALYRIINKAAYQKRKKEISEQNKALRKSDVVWAKREKDIGVKRRFGLPRGWYDQKFAEQNGLCAICKRPPHEPNGRRLSIDHDHATGRIRGLLCSDCNMSLGKLLHSKDILLSAIRYLDQE